MCLLAGTLRIELRPSDLESLALTVTLYPEISKALLTKGKVKLIYKMEQIVGFEPTPYAW